VKEALERFKVASTGRWAVSIRIYMLTVPFAVLINMERENILNPGNSTRSFAICMFGEFASYLYIFVAQATLLKHRRIRQQRLLTCLFVWFSTGTVKGIFFVIYAVWAYGLEFDFPQRIIAPTLFAGISSGMLAFYFGSIERRRIESKALDSLDEFLSIDEGVMVAADAKARKEAVATLQSTLGPQIEKLQSVTSSMALGATSAKAEVNLVLQQSQAIASAVNHQARAISRSRANLADSRSKRVTISYFSGLFPKVISVRITVLVIILGASTGQMTRNGPLGVASGFLGAAIMAVVLLILRTISKKLFGNKLTYFILASYVIVFLTQAIYVANLSRIGFNLENPYMPWYSGLKTIYGFYLASMIANLLVDSTENFEGLKRENDARRATIAALDRDQENLTQHIFTTRFGTIQGKISGVTMAMQLLSSTPEGMNHHEKAQELLSNAHELLTDVNLEIKALSEEVFRAK
jgi:hypothetical protein